MLSSSGTIVLYGSETGNSESLARRIGEEMVERLPYFQSKGVISRSGASLSPLDEFELWFKSSAGSDSKKLAIIVTSSTGDGEAPKNAGQFLKYLEGQLSTIKGDVGLPLRELFFAVLGMGDKDYDDTFGQFPTQVFVGLVKLGAQPILSLEITDENEGIELISEPWIQKLWPAIIRLSENLPSELSSLLTQSVKPIVVVKETPVIIAPSSSVDKELNLTLPPVFDQKLKIEVPASFGEVTGLPRMPAEVCNLINKPGSMGSVTSNRPQFKNQAFPSLIWGQVKKVASLTSGEALKRTLAIEIEPPKDSLQYIPGDVIGIVQPNDEQLVALLLQRLGLDGDASFFLETKSGNLPSHLLPYSGAPITPKELLAHVLDVLNVLKKPLLRVLSQCCSNPSESVLLDWLASKQGAAQFNALRDQVPTLLELLHTFPSSQPTIARLLDVLSPLQPRHYSITTTPLTSSNIQLIFNVVQYRSQNLLRHGLFTPWLDRVSGLVSPKSDLVPKDLKLPFFLKPHGPMSFHMPSNPRTPLILVGPGTGVAPLLSFVRHRQAQRALARRAGTIGPRLEDDLRARFGPIWMIAGFRHPELDFLAGDELQAMVQDSTIERLDVAFSRLETASFSQPAAHLGCREPISFTASKYVQDALLNNASYWKELMMTKGAQFYLCGDAGDMARDVNATLLRLLEGCELGDLTPAAQLASWNKEGRIRRDLW